MSEVTALYPSKWDIIPVHQSDRAAFRNCRRAWGWGSPSKANLVPKASVLGIRVPLWFGTGIHHALERYYRPGLTEDPVVSWQAWFDMQLKGGIVQEDELREYVDRDPMPVVKQTIEVAHDGILPPGTYDAVLTGTEILYRVRGLEDILPVYDPAEFEALRDLGTGMMKFYSEWAPEHDNFTVVKVEHEFSVPVLDLEGNPLYMVDTRPMPEGWEPDLTTENLFGPLQREVDVLGMDEFDMRTGLIEKQVHARGRIDMIVRDNSSGRYGIVDFKTTARLDDDYFRHLELDEQCTSYLALGEIEAILSDAPYKQLEFITYQAMLKGYPTPPTVLKSGLPSMARTTETTTAALFDKFVKENGLSELIEADVKYQSYYAYLIEIGDDRFVHRENAWRNKIQRQNSRERLYFEALDMLSPATRLYPNPRKEYSCLNCVFRGPCLAAEDGSDWKAMLEDGFVSNYDR